VPSLSVATSGPSPNGSSSSFTGNSAVQQLAISSLLGSDSPRISGENADHVELLAASGAPLPPILVHRETMRVIDGMHRVRAAMLRGEDTIPVQFFDGPEEEAFVRGVKANIEHGLPLTRADRETAAARIIATHPHYSDRRIAADTGLAAHTVAAIRRSSPNNQTSARMGRDGRIRPVDPEYGRRIARDALLRHPQASMREIARIAGISPGTVRAVRRKMAQGENPVPLQRRANSVVGAQTAAPKRDPLRTGRKEKRSFESLLDRLTKDPSLRSTEPGRMLLRFLHSRVAAPAELGRLVGEVPPHSLFLVAELARSCADEWLELAQQLEEDISENDLLALVRPQALVKVCNRAGCAVEQPATFLR
jgi:ParB-like chromosome segregation protein Spo0J